MTYLSPFLTALVAIAPESEPAPGSVNPNEMIFSPDATMGPYFFFCSSVPPMSIGSQPRAWPYTISDELTHATAISSTARQV